tara:strand:- start:9616 stop:10881 length:1266 start_codon:yes stop_codon:yes gene_type:complete
MENKQNNIHVVNLSYYTAPVIVEDVRKEYIGYGEDNNYFKFIIDRFIGSVTNASIINGVSSMIYGQGVKTGDEENQEAFEAKLNDKDLKNIILDRKMLGMAAISVEYTNGEVSKLSHFPMNTLRSGKADDKGNVTEWLYFYDWDKKTSNDNPTAIPVYGSGNKNKSEVYVIKPYVPGYFYYSPVDYTPALDYALQEQEISTYLLNDVMNGFSGTRIINFNNGVPEIDVQREIKRDVINKLTGASGDRVIVAFNDNVEAATSVENIPLDNAPDHYAYLSAECSNKILVGHRITSPLLIGVRSENNGLGSNADEIDNAYKLFYSTTIKAYQDEIVTALEDILGDLELYFVPNSPTAVDDVADLEDAGVDEEIIEEETGIDVSEETEVTLSVIERIKKLFTFEPKDDIPAATEDEIIEILNNEE